MKELVHVFLINYSSNAIIGTASNFLNLQLYIFFKLVHFQLWKLSIAKVA